MNAAAPGRTLPPVILELDEFANLCGWFYNAYLRDGIEANNGYNCSHPEQEEIREDETSGKTAGCCFCWSCPLAYAPGPEEMIEHGAITEEDAAESIAIGESIYRGDSDYVVVSDEAMIARLRERGIGGLAGSAIGG